MLAVAVHRELLPVDAGFQRPVHRFQKVVAMRLHMESDQVGAQQAVQQLPLPGADSKGLRIRPGNVPENRDARIGTLLLDHARQQREVIVLNQHHRILFSLDLLQQRVRELPIHGFVEFPVFGAESRASVGDVAERPQALICESQIEPLFFFLGQPQPAKSVLRMVGRNTNAIVLIHGFAVRIAGSLRDPGAVAGAQNRLKRGHQAAGGNLST